MASKSKDIEVPENSDICIIGHEVIEKGYRVKDDRVLGLMRSAKQKLRMKLKNNRLYVCEHHREEYMKKRKGFERNIMMLAAMAAILFVVIFIVNVMSGDIWKILQSILLGILIFLMVPIFLFFIYVPAIEEKMTHAREGKKR
jgi:1-aminocyclopropane-1-carboxylate deaminase/D-cysteine desulfhydrase-like pyridoxal-dependent ACC family enzyme